MGDTNVLTLRCSDEAEMFFTCTHPDATLDCVFKKKSLTRHDRTSTGGLYVVIFVIIWSVFLPNDENSVHSPTFEMILSLITIFAL